MDKRQKTIAVIKALHSYQDSKIDAPEMIKIVCDYYDSIKDTNLSESDLQFLKKTSNVVGIPHYFDHLNIFQNKAVSLEDFSLNYFSAQLYESTLHTCEDSKVHRYQKKVLSLFQKNVLNRYFLSASTSFGKTYLVYEIMKKMRYKNIVLVFPTIALLTENLEKLHNNELYSSYRIHTLSDVTPEEMKYDSIFIYTPERFLSFLEKHAVRPSFDFIFIDEIYKIDNEYIIDEEEKKENERDISYRIATYYSVLGNADILLAGPYIEKQSPSFERFLSDNKISQCNFNQYEIVGKSYHEIKSSKKVNLGDNLIVEFDDNEAGKEARLNKVVSILTKTGKNEGCIIYCSTPPAAEKYAKHLPKLVEYESCPEEYKVFVEHVSREYGKDWVVTSSMKKGVGVHHGLIPKYIQKEIIYFFNKGIIKALTSTTTITEGVNTSAKNLIITNNKKGNKPLKRFDAKNIAGRAGRFDKHYSGRVIVIQNKFLDDINAEMETIHHKNYDLNSKKNAIDIFYSGSDFLTNEDISKKESIILEQIKRGIPDHILDMFKVVSKSDKIEVYDCITRLNKNQHAHLKLLIQKVNMPMHVSINWDGLQIILECINSIANESLTSLINQKTNHGEGDHSILIPMLHNYLEKGFKGLVSFKMDKGESVDQATRSTARFVYNTAKYQLVKYFGVFNVMYKFHRSKSENIEFERVSGIDRLLTKLEYNALTELGRKVSDYGVPAKVLNYYENEQKNDTKNSFDEFEKRAFTSVERVVKR